MFLAYYFTHRNNNTKLVLIHTALTNSTSTLKSKKKNDLKIVLFLVPETGVEPARLLHRGILSPLRLPIPPLRQIKKSVNSF